jgi:hypothetical protein
MQYLFDRGILMTRDDENWFDLLAGKHVNAVDNATRQEAEALRTSTLASSTSKERAQHALKIAAFQRLKQRLKNEGLVAQHVKKSNSWLALAASLIVCGGLAVIMREQLFPLQENAQEVSRGGTNTSTSNTEAVIVENAMLAAQELKEKLTPFGILLHIRGDGALSSAEGYVPGEQEDQVNQILTPYKKAVGENGHLSLTFRGEVKPR